MKQWQLGTEPGIKNLKVVERPRPQPGRGEVLVRIRAASLNYRDLLVAKGVAPFTAGRIPLSDGAGEIIEVGPEVIDWKVGDRVAGLFFRDWTSGCFEMRYHDAALGGSVDGVLTEEAVFAQSALVAIPANYSYEQAATLPCAGLTAWYSLVTRGKFKPGDSVLLLGTGGVSIWGLQIAQASGGRCIITSSSDEKLEQAKALGAWATVNYQTVPDWEREILRLTDDAGVDHVLEVGGPGTLAKSLHCVSAGGHLAMIGVLTGFSAPDASLFPLVAKNATMNGIYVGHREAFREFVQFLDRQFIPPVVHRCFDFEDSQEAYKHLESSSHFGKVVIRL